MAKLTDIMFLQQPEQTVLTIERLGDIQTFSQLIGEGFMKIGKYMDELGEVTTDIPFVEYPAYEEMTGHNIKLNIGFYTAKALPTKEDMQSITIPARRIAVCLHKGTYDELASLYMEMAEWIKAKGYQHSGTSIEHYYTGPKVPETEHITRVVMPVKERL